jgi:hypothetical protein
MDYDDCKPAADKDMGDGDRKPAALNMEDVFENDLTQSDITAEPSIILPSLPPLPVASALAQLDALDTGNVPHPASTLAQSVTLDTGNVAQSASTHAQSTIGATITTEIAAAIAINALAAESHELSFPHQISQTNVPLFIFYSLCI